MTTMYKGFHIAEGFEGECQKVVIDEPYYRNLPLNSEDIVLDIGACIGTFARLAAPVVKSVICYEPDPGNFTYLQLNCQDLTNVSLVHAAVVGDKSKKVDLWLGSNGTIHATTKYRGRDSITVPAVNFIDQVLEYCPSILKIDIEGGEYEFKELLDLPTFVKKIFIEIHLNRKEWRGGLANQLVESFEKQGFRWLKAPRFTRANWTTNVVGVR